MYWKLGRRGGLLKIMNCFSVEKMTFARIKGNTKNFEEIKSIKIHLLFNF